MFIQLFIHDWLPFFYSHLKMSATHFVFAMALGLTHRGSDEVQYRWGVVVEEEVVVVVVMGVGVLCVSALVTGPSGPLPGCAFTWTLPPQSASTSQTRLASLAGPAVALLPDPMIHSVGEISSYPAHSQRAVRGCIEQWDVKTALYKKGCNTTKNKQ